jgi:hypothetical protein
MSLPEIVLVRLCEEIAETLVACDDIEIDRTQRIGWEAQRAQATVSRVRVQTELLRCMPMQTAVNGARARLLRVQRHLLRMLAAEDAIDCERVCAVLEHLYNEVSSVWSDRAYRLAEDLGIALDRTPRDCTRGVSLRDP